MNTNVKAVLLNDKKTGLLIYEDKEGRIWVRDLREPR